MSVFQTASSALNSLQKATSVTAENIATSKTYGTKPKSYVFHNTVAGNSISSGNYIAGNVNFKVIQNNEVLGNLQDSSGSTHFAFDSVKGYAVVTSDLVNPQNAISYTRACDFNPDADGYLKNSADQFLLGWKLDETTEDIPLGTNTNLLSSLEPINVQQVNGTFTPTTNAKIRVNLPSNATAGPPADTYVNNVRIIDSQGMQHNVVLTWTKTAVANEWNISLSCPDALSLIRTDTLAAYDTATGPLVHFDTSGYLVDFDGNPAAATAQIQWAPLGVVADTLLTFDFGTPASASALRIMGTDFIESVNDDNGREFATVERTYIDVEGNVSTIFRNSNSLKIFRVAVANFNAINELEPQSGNSFTQTNLSGNYVLGFANNAGNARIVSGKLEVNPTNLAEQLTKLIELQHLNAAVVRTITAEDKMLNEVSKL